MTRFIIRGLTKITLIIRLTAKVKVEFPVHLCLFVLIRGLFCDPRSLKKPGHYDPAKMRTSYKLSQG